MIRSLTLGQQIALGVLAPFLLLLIVLSPLSFFNNRATLESGNRAGHTQVVMMNSNELLGWACAADSAANAYALTGRDDALAAYKTATERLEHKIEDLRRLLSVSSDQQMRVAAIQQAVREAQRARAEMMDARRSQGLLPAAQVASQGHGRQALDELHKLIDSLNAAQTEQLSQHVAEYESTMRRAFYISVASAPFCLAIMVFAVVFIIRNMNRQIGTAIQHLRSSAAELQAAASQQAKGAKGQAATATEVATTMRELVSTSRQIADSTQRVTGIATETSHAARTGDSNMQSAQAAVQQIKHQVDRIVTHMLDLGKRSQEIGSILDIINELAEQTNILAINATIEAAGAGESGRRFAVVADEIRKLADRVGGSTKEIRGLIEEVRAAANTTVMVTEDGSKAVDSSARQFVEVAASFRRIVELVGNTTEASREIELSTKQQTTAVEQASTAITDVAQTARETDASSAQMMATAAQLSDLSQQLIKLVRRSTQD
jgi:methyl-accepting chemotaxis protein